MVALVRAMVPPATMLQSMPPRPTAHQAMLHQAMVHQATVHLAVVHLLMGLHMLARRHQEVRAASPEA